MGIVTTMCFPPYLWKYSISEEGVMAYTNQHGEAILSLKGEKYSDFLKRVEELIVIRAMQDA